MGNCDVRLLCNGVKETLFFILFAIYFIFLTELDSFLYLICHLFRSFLEELM